ncbi:hypothetical protein TRFO_12245 [Tritrichomonas foetus]|uniref:Phosphorylase n=1 Tax=Tritrichomonas foetus TaxID=1144522 RepID=A0A1J4J295_9EUKA|nr:hypothetical protein TRFO_12245 [Tritrichomonas foetus]|eukprot:OHS92873.1 hypothetical protein TRFO_12245 [Tritrichomonas foetus]
MSLKQKILSEAKFAQSIKHAYQLFLQNPETIVDQGFQFIMHYYDPALLKDLSDQPVKRRVDPLLPPFESHMHVCDLTKDDAEHHVIINKFMQCQGHIVLSSIDKNAEQGSDLTRSDCSAFTQIINAFENEGIAYYNAGLESGCSQLHKHIQFTPIKEAPIFDAMVAKEKLPIVYHSEKLNKITPDEILSAYKDLLKQAEKDPKHKSYNFIVAHNHAVYVPRSKAQHSCGICINSFAICGHYSLWQWSDPIIKNAPLSILKDVCFPQ